MMLANFWDSSWIWAADNDTNSVRHTKYVSENHELNVSRVVSCGLKENVEKFLLLIMFANFDLLKAVQQFDQNLVEIAWHW